MPQEAPATVLNSLMEITAAGGALGIPGLYVTGDPGGIDEAAKKGSLSLSLGTGWAKSLSFTTGQCPVMKYNRQLMMAILHDKVHIAKNVNAKAITLEDAPQGLRGVRRRCGDEVRAQPERLPRRQVTGRVAQGHGHGNVRVALTGPRSGGVVLPEEPVDEREHPVGQLPQDAVPAAGHQLDPGVAHLLGDAAARGDRVAEPRVRAEEREGGRGDGAEPLVGQGARPRRTTAVAHRGARERAVRVGERHAGGEPRVEAGEIAGRGEGRERGPSATSTLRYGLTSAVMPSPRTRPADAGRRRARRTQRAANHAPSE